MVIRLIKPIVVASIALAVLAALRPGPGLAASNPIPVGMVVPLTGPLATYGTPFSSAVQMAFDEVNAAGGIGGRKIELRIEDSQASNTVAINALNRLLQSKPVALFGPSLGTQILAMFPIIEKERLPLLAGPSTRRVTQQGAKYFFRVTSHDGVTKDLVTRFLIEDLKSKRVGIIHVANEWGYSGRDNVSADLQEMAQLKPVSIASYQPTDRDLTAQLLQMKNDGADVIFTQGHPVDEAIIVRQMKQLNIDVPHIGSGSLCGAALLKLLTADELAGQYCDGPDVLPELNTKPAVQEFVSKFTKKTGFPPGVYETFYYDAAHMIAHVMEQYGADRESIAKGMRETAYKGILGTLKADAEGNLWQGAAIVKFLPGGGGEIARRVGSGGEAK